jgi:spermidine synthase
LAIHPRIKHWLSYLFEWPIGSFSTPYNHRLEVVLHQGRYKLITDGAIYSFGDLYSNYRRSFEQLNWSSHQFHSCLVLGLGLGSIPDMLTQVFKKEMEFTAVEIDEVVTKLAIDYVLKPKHIKVQVFTADAASFLEWHVGKYDLICSDVFVGDHIPADLETIEALEAMRDMLKPGGILMYNRLSRYQPDIDKNLRFRNDVFLKVFPEGGYLDVGGNWMFVSRLSDFSHQ